SAGAPATAAVGSSPAHGGAGQAGIDPEGTAPGAGRSRGGATGNRRGQTGGGGSPAFGGKSGHGRDGAHAGGEERQGLAGAARTRSGWLQRLRLVWLVSR